MKKIIIAFLIFATALSLVACTNKNQGETNGEGSSTACEHEIKYKLNEDEKGYTLTSVGKCTCENVIIPETYEGLPITTIGDSAFFNCQTVKSVTISSNVTEIWHRAFANCRSLESVNIPSSVTGIGYYVFSGCLSLKSVTIPASVTFIGGDIFQMCNDVTINCEVESQPKQWHTNWNSSFDVNWGYKG